MQMSETIGALATALAAAQATIGGAVKDRVNPAFKSKYADLSSVWDAWQQVGPAQGLGVVQLPGEMVDGKVTLTTVLTHKSGEWMRETLSIPVTKQDAQGYGSALTYARRYGLSALVGIAPEDDDGNAAVAPKGAPKREALEGPHATVSALKEAVRAFAMALSDCSDGDTLEGTIDDAKPMLAQVRRYLPDWWNGGEGIDRTLPETMDGHRARVARIEADGVPRDPGPPAAIPEVEMDESVKVMITLIHTQPSVKDLDTFIADNKALIDAASDDDKQALREAVKAAKDAIRALRNHPVNAG